MKNTGEEDERESEDEDENDNHDYENESHYDGDDNDGFLKLVCATSRSLLTLRNYPTPATMLG